MDNRKRSKNLTDSMIQKLNPYAEEMYDLYWNWGLNFAEISQTLGVASPSSVYRFFAYRFGAKTREQQLKELKEVNTGRVWSEEAKENVRCGVQKFYDENMGKFLNDDGTPKENCPYKSAMYVGKKKQEGMDNLFEFCFGNPREFLQLEYIERKKSIDDISVMTGFSRTYLTSLLKRCGFQIRDKWCANRGKKHPMSEKQKKKMSEVFSQPEVYQRRSEAQKRYWSTVPYEERIKRTRNGCVAGFNAVNSMTGMSSIEAKVKEQLDELGVRYIQQKEVCDGNKVYYLDFYLPDYKLVVECNGDYWHNLPNRKQRDKDLENFVKRTNHNIIFIWEHEINDEWFWVGDYLEEHI
jgi:very-short-patch-repair endonuclease